MISRNKYLWWLVNKGFWRLLRPKRPMRARMTFRCNVCGRPTTAPVLELERETRTCASCGSTVRSRALIHHLSQTLFGSSLAIHEFPKSPETRVLDMSGWEGYGNRLDQKLTYINSFFHKEPRLDITEPPEAWEGSFDAIISSDVFEHVVPPVSLAFLNTLKLLKPGGTLILTVPYTTASETIEHFPELHRYEIVKQNGEYRLCNQTIDGRRQWFDNLVFHGGPGTTLEMRVFCEADLDHQLASAGFSDIHFRGEPAYDAGIIWHNQWSLPITARKPD